MEKLTSNGHAPLFEELALPEVCGASQAADTPTFCHNATWCTAGNTGQVELCKRTK